MKLLLAFDAPRCAIDDCGEPVVTSELFITTDDFTYLVPNCPVCERHFNERTAVLTQRLSDLYAGLQGLVAS